MYMQYFCGLRSFQAELLFDASLFVDIRKRIIKKASSNKEIPNQEKLKLDASIADQYRLSSNYNSYLNKSKSSATNNYGVEYHYTGLMDIEIQQGLNYDKSMGADISNAFIINEIAVNEFGWGK